MHFRDLLSSAAQSLRRTKSRSALTMLGIVIGVMSVILVLSMGEAAERYILGQVSSLGSDVITLQNGADRDETRDIPTAFIKEVLTIEDTHTLRAKPWIRHVTGVVSQSDTIVANGQDVQVQVLGTTEDEVRLYDARVAEGTFLTREQVDARSRVVVLGADVAHLSFDQEAVVGRSVKIGTQSFRVIGVMEHAGSRSFQNLDQNVYIPVTAAMDLYHKKYLSSISIRSTLPLSYAKRLIQQVVRDAHRMEKIQDDDFRVTTQEDAAKSASDIANILQILLTSIASISLVVGGIGIMNIMYVAVTERTREIGLRKAIGAHTQDILSQFLMEAVFLTTLGGVCGVVMGIGLAWLAIHIIASLQSGWTFAISMRGVFLGVGVSSVIGLVFGYAPARKAAMLRPIEALRRE